MAKDPQNHRSATDASWRLHSILCRKNLCWRFLSRPVGMSGLPHPSLPAVHGVERESFGCQLWKLFLVCGKQIHPITAQFSASLSKFGLEILRHFRRNQELRVLGPAVTSFCRPDLIFTQRFAMSCARVLFGWRAICDMAIDDD